FWVGVRGTRRGGSTTPLPSHLEKVSAIECPQMKKKQRTKHQREIQLTQIAELRPCGHSPSVTPATEFDRFCTGFSGFWGQITHINATGDENAVPYKRARNGRIVPKIVPIDNAR